MIDSEEMPTDITHHINKFRKLLSNSLPNVDELMEGHDWDDDGALIDDWLLANWELLVERELLGQGCCLTSPSIPQGYRITNKGMPSQFYVAVEIVKQSACYTDEVAESVRVAQSCQVLRFAGFCTEIKGGHGFYPPFDTATVYSEDTRQYFSIPFSLLRFFVREIDY